jgi:chorismate-pyruvate lyase
MPDLTRIREQIAGLAMTLATIRDIIEETIEVDKPAKTPLGHALRRIHRLTERDQKVADALAIIDAAIGEEEPQAPNGHPGGCQCLHCCNWRNPRTGPKYGE